MFPRRTALIKNLQPRVSGGISLRTLPGLTFLLDASVAASVINSAGAVSQWSDISGNGNNFTQPTGANKPLTGSRTINGINVLDFNSANTHTMIGPASLYGLTNGPLTLFSVFQFDNTGDAIQRVINGQDAGANRFILEASASSHSGRSSGTAAASVAAARNTAVRVAIFRRSGTDQRFWLGGGTAAVDATANDFTMTSLYLGSQSGTSNRFDGGFALIGASNRALDVSAINQIGRILAARYGAAWATAT